MHRLKDRPRRRLRRLALALLGVVCPISTCGTLACADPPTLESLSALHDIGNYSNGLSLSPDGRTLAFFERMTDLAGDRYRYNVMAADAAGGRAARVLADAGGFLFADKDGYRNGAPRDRTPLWSPDSDWVAYIAEDHRQAQLWRVRSSSGLREKLVDGPGDVNRFAWTSDGAGMVYETDTPRADLDGVQTRALAHGFEVDHRFIATYKLLPLPDPNSGRAVWFLDIATHNSRKATAVEAALLAGPNPRRAAAGTTSAAIEPIDPTSRAAEPALRLVYRSGAGASAAEHVCAAPACRGSLTAVWLGGAGDRVFFQHAEGVSDVIQAFYEWDPVSGAVRLIRRAEEKNLDCAAHAELLYCLHETSLAPRTVFRLDLGTGATTTLYDSNPGWRSLSLTRIERLDVVDPYGDDSFAHIIYPVGYKPGRRYPLVIVQYKSRGFLLGGTGGEYPVHVLAAHGYFVLSFDRPEPKELKARYDSWGWQRREFAAQEDLSKQAAIETMIAKLDARGLIDRTRIGITGLSNGAYGLYYGLTHSTLFAAAVSSTPPGDESDYFLQSDDFRASRLRDAHMGAPDDEKAEFGRAWWKTRSLADNADKVRTPLLMQLTETEALSGFPARFALARRHVPVDVYIYPGAYHIKWRPLQLYAARRRAIDWLDFWLQNRENPAPIDADQYERWRALRTDQTSTR